MQKFVIFLVLVLSSALFAKAQVDYTLRNAYEFYRSNRVATGEYRNVLTEKDIQGSPYLNDEFIKGSIYTLSKTQYADIPLRYNIYNDEIEFETEDKKVAALDAPEVVEKVTFGNYTMEYIPFEVAKKVKKGFFEILLKGKASLYARPDVEFHQAKAPQPYKDAEPAKFIRKADNYYLRFGMEPAVSCGNKKELVESFPEHKNEMEAFIKKNKINVKKEDELKKLVEYYNSL
ncbi:MAG TPA: hypothetical protein PK335_09800 [Draconibacterium sp.]|nr:hypothetical protein [Draconibacterium sp.]